MGASKTLNRECVRRNASVILKTGGQEALGSKQNLIEKINFVMNQFFIK